MATFTVNFTAQTPDTYTCGWREQGSGAPFTIETQVVSAIGAASFVITIPAADNVYCDGYVYEGYIIADCQDQTLDPVTGIPVNAIQFTATFVQQADPCPLYEITCDNVPIVSVTISGTQSGYVTGESLTFTTANPADTLVAAVGTINVTAGAITSVTITNFGSYRTIPTVGVTTTSGTGAVLTAQMDFCPDLVTSAFVCGSAMTSPLPRLETLELGDGFELCADPASFASLPAQYNANDISAVNGSCNCIPCSRATVVNTGAKAIPIQWHACPTDPTNPLVLLTQLIQFDGIPVDIGCVVPETVTNLTPFAPGLTITYGGPC